MSDKPAFLAIPGMIPALVVDALGVVAAVALAVLGYPAWAGAAFVVGSAPLILVILFHAQTLKGPGR